MTSNYQQESEDSKNRTIAFVLTTAFNAGLLAVCWYVTVWNSSETIKRELPNGGGVLVNFGTDDNGSGNVFTRNHASDSKRLVDTKPAEKVVEKNTKVKEVVEPRPKVVEKRKPTAERPVLTSNRPSPVKVKEVKETKVESKKDPVSKPVVARQPAVETSRPVQGATLPNRRNNTNGTSGSASGQGAGGDGTGGGRGNQGQTNGNVVEGGTYKPRSPGTGGGNTGGDGGTGKGSLAIAGWTWVSKPVIDIDTNDDGMIRLRFKVDSDGDVQYIEVLESTIGNPAVVAKCKAKLKATKFRPTDDNEKAPLSTGTVTFRISAH